MKKFVNWSLKRKKHTALGLYLDTLNGQLDPSSRKLITRVNSIQRARLLASYKIANEYNFLLVGSSNRTEQTVGLFVKYGIDDAADIMPLRNLLRSHLLQIAEYIQIPNLIYKRTPNPDILPGITDKYVDYFGCNYRDIELIVLGMEMKLTSKEISQQINLNEKTIIQVQEIIELNRKTQFRGLAPDFYAKCVINKAIKKALQ